MRDAEERRRFIIQVDLPGEKQSLRTISRLLKDTGVELDRGYGPIPINADIGRYVVRGWATKEARERAERIPGVVLFPDIEPQAT